jgi:radical SAM protein with 4Fe4S-binding SPASM domain
MLPLFHTLYFETTRNCNLNCRYCSTASNTTKKYPDLSLDTIVSRIFLPAWELGTKQIEFSGGEFLIRKDAYNLLEIANNIGFKISIVSNGSSLNEKSIEKLKKLLKDNLLISLGINEFSFRNKETRDVESETILSLIKLLEQYMITVNLVVTIGKFNCETFENTIKTFNELKLPYNRSPYTPRNSQCKELMFNKELMKKYIHPVLVKYFRGYSSYVPLFLSPEIYSAISLQNNLLSPVPTNPSIGCWVGSFYGINPEGEVAPCPLLLDHLSGGNILKTDLKKILFESELFTKIIQRENLGGKCGSCKFNYTCGGCRVMAYFQTGDVFAEDPTCFIDDLTKEELEKLEAQTAKEFKNYNRMTKFSNVFS